MQFELMVDMFIAAGQLQRIYHPWLSLVLRTLLMAD